MILGVRMMRIRIDDHEEQRFFANREQFVSYWSEITTFLLRQERYIYQVKANGETIHEEYDSYLAEHYQDIDRLELVTVDKSELVRDTLKEMNIYTKKMWSACDSISSLFYGEMKSEEWTYFSIFIQGLQWLYQSTSGICSLLERDASEFQALYPVLHETSTAFKEQIAHMEHALQNGDLVTVGDIIRYELSEIFAGLDQHLSEGLGDRDESVRIR